MDTADWPSLDIWTEEMGEADFKKIVNACGGVLLQFFVLRLEVRLQKNFDGCVGMIVQVFLASFGVHLPK